LYPRQNPVSCSGHPIINSDYLRLLAKSDIRTAHPKQDWDYGRMTVVLRFQAYTAFHVGKMGHTTRTRCKEHTIMYVPYSNVSFYSWTKHGIRALNELQWPDCLVKKAIGIQLHPHNFNTDQGFIMSQSQNLALNKML
jgi:hypothetical protein